MDDIGLAPSRTLRHVNLVALVGARAFGHSDPLPLRRCSVLALLAGLSHSLG
jgi:hypothetical protein